MRTLILAMLVMLVPSAHAQECNDLSAVEWMAGAWETEDAVRRTAEHWAPISEHTMEGEGRVYRKEGGSLTGSESLRLVDMGGEVFYLAKTRGNPLPIAFRLESCTDDSATFENPDHDFPQRLVYRHPSRDALHVEVSDLDGNGFLLEFVRGAN